MKTDPQTLQPGELDLYADFVGFCVILEECFNYKLITVKVGYFLAKRTFFFFFFFIFSFFLRGVNPNCIFYLFPRLFQILFVSCFLGFLSQKLRSSVLNMVLNMCIQCCKFPLSTAFAASKTNLISCIFNFLQISFIT